MSACSWLRFFLAIMMTSTVLMGSEKIDETRPPPGITTARYDGSSASSAVRPLSHSFEVVRPFFSRSIPDQVKDKLARGLSIAREHVRDHPSCQDLFQRLGRDGLGTLNATHFIPTTRDQERRYCRRGSIYAITTVGGSVVKPCPQFASLSDNEAAIILIHEALHNAGQTESPHDRRAPNSEEITRIVIRKCGF